MWMSIFPMWTVLRDSAFSASRGGAAGAAAERRLARSKSSRGSSSVLEAEEVGPLRSRGSALLAVKGAEGLGGAGAGLALLLALLLGLLLWGVIAEYGEGWTLGVVAGFGVSRRGAESARLSARSATGCFAPGSGGVAIVWVSRGRCGVSVLDGGTTAGCKGSRRCRGSGFCCHAGAALGGGWIGSEVRVGVIVSESTGAVSFGCPVESRWRMGRAGRGGVVWGATLSGNGSAAALRRGHRGAAGACSRGSLTVPPGSEKERR